MGTTAIRRRHTRKGRSSGTSPGRVALFVAVVGALSALIGSIAPTAVAWKTTTSTNRTNRETLDVTARGQAADRFTAAVEQIGSDRLSVRLGGVYALDRIAKDDSSYYYQVKSVLAAFVRTNAARNHGSAADVVAALNFVLPTIPWKETAADLSGAEINGVELRDRNANQVILRRARLENVSFRGSYLVGARLEDAVLSGDLEGTTLANAFLCGADLSGAEVVLSNSQDRQKTNLSGAVMDRRTKLPSGVTAAQLGIIRGRCSS